MGQPGLRRLTLRRTGAAPTGGGPAVPPISGANAGQVAVADSATTLTSYPSFTFTDLTATLDVAKARDGGAVTCSARNTSNTASSSARVLAEVAGSSAGNAQYSAAVAGVTTWSWGIDNANSDRFALAVGTNLATSPILTASATTGEVAINSVPTAGATLMVAGTDAAYQKTTFLASSAVGLSFIQVQANTQLLQVLAYGASSGGTFSGENKASLAVIDAYNFNTFVIAHGSIAKLAIDVTNGVGVIPASGQRAWIGGTIKTIQADAGNVGTGEDPLHSYTLPAAMLSANGQAIEVEVVVTFAANANNKRLKLHFGGTVIFDSTAVAQNGGTCVIRARVTRTGATTQRAFAYLVGGSSLTDDAQYTTPGETLSGTVVIKTTGEATDNDDIVARVTAIRWAQALN